MGKKFTVQIWVIPVNKFCPWILQAWSFGFWKQLGDSTIGISIFWGQISILWLMTTDNKISSVPSSLLPDFGSRGTPRPGRGSWRSQKGFCSGAHKEMFKMEEKENPMAHPLVAFETPKVFSRGSEKSKKFWAHKKRLQLEGKRQKLNGSAC